MPVRTVPGCHSCKAEKQHDNVFDAHVCGVCFAVVLCQVKIIIEQQRIALGYGVHQIFINTDLVAGTSGTFTDSVR